MARSLSKPWAFLREAPICKKLIPKLVPIRPKKLPQHVGAMSRHHAKFHDFQACFGFTGIRNTKFLNISGRATTPRCLNFIPISCMGPRNSPKDTHVIFQPTLAHWNMCLYFKFELCTQRWHVPSQNHEPSWEKLRFARSSYQNLFQFGQVFYHNMLVPCHDCMPSFLISRQVLDLRELKNQVSQSFRPSHNAQMFEFHSHFLHGT